MHFIIVFFICKSLCKAKNRNLRSDGPLRHTNSPTNCCSGAKILVGLRAKGLENWFESVMKINRFVSPPVSSTVFFPSEVSLEKFEAE